MNLPELIQAKELLYKQISPKLTGTKESYLLVEAINNLQVLIKRLEDPLKAKYLDKLCN